MRDHGLVSAFEDLIARATADPRVRGLVLSGSQARGLGTGHSDHDVFVVVDEADQWTTSRSTELDEIVYTVDGLGDTSLHWQRYAFRGAQVLLDRLGGGIAERVATQATPTAAEATAWARENLDGLVNQLYRAAKSRRDGADLAARLDEMESVGWFFATVFTLHGRLRPYNKYLQWELATHPLPEPWDAGFPARVAADPPAMFADVAALARRCGHGDVLDSWGDDLALLLR